MKSYASRLQKYLSKTPGNMKMVKIRIVYWEGLGTPLYFLIKNAIWCVDKHWLFMISPNEVKNS